MPGGQKNEKVHCKLAVGTDGDRRRTLPPCRPAGPCLAGPAPWRSGPRWRRWRPRRRPTSPSRQRWPRCSGATPTDRRAAYRSRIHSAISRSTSLPCRCFDTMTSKPLPAGPSACRHAPRGMLRRAAVRHPPHADASLRRTTHPKVVHVGHAADGVHSELTPVHLGHLGANLVGRPHRIAVVPKVSHCQRRHPRRPPRWTRRRTGLSA